MCTEDKHYDGTYFVARPDSFCWGRWWLRADRAALSPGNVGGHWTIYGRTSHSCTLIHTLVSAIVRGVGSGVRWPILIVFTCINMNITMLEANKESYNYSTFLYQLVA